ncbi:hypothetical protein PJ985_09675 [Streptomyces sp. ACA25]|uniref:hypothetical protein n=1 Tax=Streptomyces sp. ACA25 TaxID=3022596 RepID=UPI002307E4E3|nr:hypothetical protein [Streptomyces sp. ACA25]MDB1087832.1 hypothetical protein [Streptomyces sp. ACA25]
MALFSRKPVGSPGEWFYCLKHGKVEEGPECPAKDRFGPYPSPDEAARAMDTARDRNMQWRTDPRWDDREDGEDGGDEGRGGGPDGPAAGPRGQP